MIEFLNFGNDATYRIFDWIVKTSDVDSMIAAAKELVTSQADVAKWPSSFDDPFAMADALAEIIDEKIQNVLGGEAKCRGLDLETWLDEKGEESILAALIGVSVTSVSSLIVAKALLIKVAGWKPSI